MNYAWPSAVRRGEQLQRSFAFDHTEGEQAGMKHSTYSHCAGAERVSAAIQAQVVKAIAAIEAPYERGAVRTIRAQMSTALKEQGWAGEVAVSRGSDMTITSMQDGIGLCIQTGNMARIYADLIKLQTLYLDNAISAAVLIVPSQPLALAIGDNLAQATRLERELEIFRKAYHVPTLLFALE